MAWNIGRLIDLHLLQNNQNSDYGEQLFRNLANDCEISLSNLYKMQAFFKSYPRLPQDDDMTWSHYRVLSRIEDQEKRQSFEKLTKENALSAAKLQKQVSKNQKLEKVQNSAIIEQLEVERGKLFNYFVREIAGEKFLDLGFHIFQDFAGDFEIGQAVESIKNGEEFSLQTSTLRKDEMYTYQAVLDKVVDGDTIRVYLDLGFGIKHLEILRLTQINAPESDTAEGEIATKKLKEILKNVKNLIIRTNKTDIYGRYIADVFLEDVEGEYLSQILLDARVVGRFES